MSTVKSIIAFVIAPVFIAIGAQITTGTRFTKLIYWAISFVFIALWLFAKEAYS